VVFALARQLGILPLTGTSDPEHMRDDLAAVHAQLTVGELQAIQLG
jgi:aryl-alcohol dehydrogenase-like predicted oxidoreductase